MHQNRKFLNTKNSSDHILTDINTNKITMNILV